ncbi:MULTISPECIES: ABC transporter ATP-binding protein [unclassified Rhodococcus (in: high G+C Gram-positive bacteria)]|uniref:ABC transporter ATP-binding protein n=1 Tax=unclassified Rhodococcus (in: high G+C Gram-positive bacteria) TaxID=192944 RepID=UPI0029533F06|nr:ATP-binding cassette domain-containing protein [Rhodococcus sp. IEGM 1343]MDV8056286.1 ATP-binding cassette domain-containing protein [Rhodococcus sp. IEGM 1343]
MNFPIEVQALSKSYGNKLVIDGLSFVVEPGTVTGFLGPNGSGKSTTMRLIVGLDRPSAGTALIGGVEYAQLSKPLLTVGTLLDSEAVHPGRSAYAHLLYLARTQHIPTTRIIDVLELVGLRDVSGERTGSFSLGMRKRLGIAAALLGDPTVLILDEPINGLDPDGIYWMRNLMKNLAGEGRTVFVSSHLMGEMAQTADHLVVIDHGRLIAECTPAELIARSSRASVLVSSSDSTSLAAVIEADGGTADILGHDGLTVHDLSAHRVGELAQQQHIAIYQLTPQEASLEEAFMTLTHLDDVEHDRQLVTHSRGQANP